MPGKAKPAKDTPDMKTIIYIALALTACTTQSDPKEPPPTCADAGCTNADLLCHEDGLCICDLGDGAKVECTRDGSAS
jgi:hypothetical protein